jgi:hypothetical protein
MPGEEGSEFKEVREPDPFLGIYDAARWPDFYGPDLSLDASPDAEQAAEELGFSSVVYISKETLDAMYGDSGII